MDTLIYGGDTETLHGKPMSMQFYSEDVACEDLIFTNEKRAFKDFIAWCKRRRRKVLHVIYVHFLDFDMPEFLYGAHSKLVEGEGDFDFTADRLRFSGVYGGPNFLRISNGSDLQILMVDSFSYFRGTLLKASELFCPDLPKLKRVSGLGTKKFTARDTSFCAYAMRDAEVAYWIGKAIQSLVIEYDIEHPISVADMAAKIFKRKYLTYEIPQPDSAIIRASMLAYHGGVNNMVGAPGWYPDTKFVDIKSAYPAEAAAMPAFSDARLYKRYRGKARTTSVPNYGVYYVQGKVGSCDWPCVFTHAFSPIRGAVDGVWIQGHELNEALRSRELRLTTKLIGYSYDHEKDHQASAFRAYMLDFFARKESASDPVMRYMYKVIGLSLTGKLIQTTKRGRGTSVDADTGEITTAADLKAGGLFHPFIAAAVTAAPRARIHRLGHELRGIHAATDSVATQHRLPKGLIGGKQLGALSLEASGDFLMLRNKLYILYGDKPLAGKDPFPSRAFAGKYILKYALHGFQGKVTDLERMAATGKRTYEVEKPYRLREATKRGIQFNDFQRREFRLNIPPLKVR